MAEYVGMDVSLEEVSICVMDGSGRVVARGTTPTDPAAIVAFIEEQAPDVVRIVHESGQISIWLTRELKSLGAPVICIDARMAHKALSARPSRPHGLVSGGPHQERGERPAAHAYRRS